MKIKITILFVILLYMNLSSAKGQEKDKDNYVMSEAYRELWNQEVQAKIDNEIKPLSPGIWTGFGFHGQVCTG